MNYKEERPWGSFEVLKDEATYKAKVLIVNPGEELSLQSHRKREEYWVVVKGTATAQLDDDVFEKGYGEVIHVEKEQKHRLMNRSDEDVHIVEVQIGTYFGEDDEIRYEDKYGRTSPNEE